MKCLTISKEQTMNILAVDTSGPVAGIAILKDGCVTFEETVGQQVDTFCEPDAHD